MGGMILWTSVSTPASYRPLKGLLNRRCHGVAWMLIKRYGTLAEPRRIYQQHRYILHHTITVSLMSMCALISKSMSS